MRITHLIASMDPSAGGPPVVVECLARAQQALGHAVSIACQDSVIETKSNDTRPPLPYHFLPHVRIPVLSGRIPLPEGTDILHIHGVWEPVLRAAARTARKLGVPYLVAPHGMLDPWSLQQKRWKKRLALALGYRRMLNHAVGLHVLNVDESRLLDPLRLTSERIVIPNGIFLDELDPPPDAARFRANPKGPGQRPYILFLSRLHYKKGLDYLADAFAQVAPRFPDVLLVVVGPDGGAEQHFRQQIERLGLTDRVRLPGPLFGAEKWSALAGASVFCLPSRQEGFSVAILEALACRVPVVVSDQCHFPEIAEVSAGHVVPLDSASVAEALADVLANSAKSQAMGEAGRRLVEERFTWPQVAAKSIEVYNRLAVRPAMR